MTACILERTREVNPTVSNRTTDGPQLVSVKWFVTNVNRFERPYP